MMIVIIKSTLHYYCYDYSFTVICWVIFFLLTHTTTVRSHDTWTKNLFLLPLLGKKLTIFQFFDLSADIKIYLFVNKKRSLLYHTSISTVFPKNFEWDEDNFLHFFFLAQKFSTLFGKKNVEILMKFAEYGDEKFFPRWINKFFFSFFFFMKNGWEEILCFFLIFREEPSRKSINDGITGTATTPPETPPPLPDSPCPPLSRKTPLSTVNFLFY